MTRTRFRLTSLLAAGALFALGCAEQQPPAQTAAPAEQPEHSAAQATPSPAQLHAIELIQTKGASITTGDDGLPTAIDLASNRLFADEELVDAVLTFPGLTRLDLTVSNVTPEKIAELSTLTQLEELLLQDAPLDDAGLVRLLQAMSRLSRLTLRRPGHLTDQGVAAIADCEKLEVLALIEMSQLTGAGLDHLRKLPALRSLDLRNCGALTEEDFAQLSKLQGLTELKLGGPNVNDRVLEQVASLPKLTSLTIEDAEISDAGMQQLAGQTELARRLRRLALARCFGVMDDGLTGIDLFTSLETLSLRGVMVTGSFLAAESKPLPLKSLIIVDGFVSDEALTKLPSIVPHLEQLDVRGNQGITASSLEVFGRLPKLNELKTEGTGIGGEASK